jgi:type II secretory pathway pseudopilin PulG
MQVLHSVFRDRVRGMSLLEVVIALGILTALALATVLILVPVSRQGRINRETSTADAAVQRTLEEIHATPFNDLLDQFPDGSDEIVPDLPDGSLAVSYADPTADPLEIELTLSWMSPEIGAMEVVFNTLRTE